MLLNAPYPADIRVKKEADTLLSHNHNIFLVCLRRRGEKRHSIEGGIKVFRIDAGKSNYGLAFWDVWMSLTFIHPVFLREIKKVIKENNLDALHVHDLPLAGTALQAAEPLNLKVILDLHENYAEGLRVWFQWKKNILARIKNKLFMNPEKWFLHERKASKEATTVIAVVEEMTRRLVLDHHIPEKKIVVVPNTETLDFVQDNPDKEIYAKFKKKFIVAYTGGIGPHRGVDTIIEGMTKLDDYKNIILVINGTGSSSVMQFLRQKSASLGLEDRVHFQGYQPFSKFYSLMHFADVNVIPHKRNGHTDHTIPHKLFQSMMAGKPLLVSSAKPLQRIVEETQCGYVFESGNIDDFAEKLIALYLNAEQCQVMGKNGYNASVHGKYNWENTGKALLNIYTSNHT